MVSTRSIPGLRHQARHPAAPAWWRCRRCHRRPPGSAHGPGPRAGTAARWSARARCSTIVDRAGVAARSNSANRATPAKLAVAVGRAAAPCRRSPDPPRGRREPRSPPSGTGTGSCVVGGPHQGSRGDAAGHQTHGVHQPGTGRQGCPGPATLLRARARCGPATPCAHRRRARWLITVEKPPADDPGDQPAIASNLGVPRAQRPGGVFAQVRLRSPTAGRTGRRRRFVEDRAERVDRRDRQHLVLVGADRSRQDANRMRTAVLTGGLGQSLRRPGRHRAGRARPAPLESAMQCHGISRFGSGGGRLLRPARHRAGRSIRQSDPNQPHRSR